MPQHPITGRAARRLVLTVLAVLAVSLSVVAVPAGPASASGYTPWNVVADFSDGGRMSGTFRITDDGQMSDAHFVTSGGDTTRFGTSTAFDVVGVVGNGFSRDSWLVMGADRSRGLILSAAGLTGATAGSARSFGTESDELTSAQAVRRITSSVLVSGPRVDTTPPAVTLSGVPTITGAPQVGQVLQGDDGAVTADPVEATRSFQWLRDGTGIPGATGSTYTLAVEDVGSVISFQVGAASAPRPAAVPVRSAGVGPVTAVPTPVQDPIRVTAPGGLHLGGGHVQVTTTGLEPGEAYTMSIGGVTVGDGTAARTGALVRTVVVPRGIGDQRALVRVLGSGRSGVTGMRVVQAKRLGLGLLHRTLHKGQRQVVTVTGLAAGEQVTVKYRNRAISPAGAHADTAGAYRTSLRVGRLAGPKSVTVTGEFRSRGASATCRVQRHR